MKVLFAAFCLLFLSETLASSWTEQALVNRLTNNYNRLVKAFGEEDGSLVVKFGIELIRIDNLEDNVLTMFAYVFTQWQDRRLSWDPSQFDGIKYINLPHNVIWLTDIQIYNDRGSDDLHGRGWNVYIASDGTVMYMPQATLKTPCPFNEDKDHEVSCNFRVGSWTYNAKQMDIQMTDSRFLVDFEDINPKWGVAEYNATKVYKQYDCCPEKYVYVDYDVLLTLKN